MDDGDILTAAGSAAALDLGLHIVAAPFPRQMGTTPPAWLTRERLALACRLIERGESRFETVARHSALGTAANLRALMRRKIGLTPLAYRHRFGPGTGKGST
ncbi:helix-turn-helix domain-containing protein [Nonomuraea maheshkhaliensis]|uniref:helix-turn-helix domain-containing protein n=1 Tax=Nonomuraea maheshkhaliensis TaxID=419590 RepID=UPI0031F91211